MCHAKMIIAVVMLHGALLGCDSGSSRNAGGASDVEGSQLRSSESTVSPATNGVNVAGQRNETAGNSESASSSEAANNAAKNGFATWLGDDRQTNTTSPPVSSVSNVENVSSPFGPFSSQPDFNNEPPPVQDATPPPPPETPRSPFGPFPTSQ